MARQSIENTCWVCWGGREPLLLEPNEEQEFYSEEWKRRALQVEEKEIQAA